MNRMRPLFVLTVFALSLILGPGLTVSAAAPGDLIINEIMQNPSAVSDSLGEWFELYNNTGADIDIEGWTIADNDFDSHLIANGGPLIVPAGGYLVLGNNTDFATNGGVNVAYSYGGSWFLSNGADEVVLFDTAATEIDRVEYDGGPQFPDPNGASMALADPALDNNLGENWCEASTPFGDGDSGTPGAANDCDTGGVDIFINELRIGLTGFPDADFFELQGAAGASLDGLTFVVLSGEVAPGQIDFAIDLSGTSIPADGFFVAAGTDASATYGITPDLAVEFDFFGSPTTHMIVSGFSGTAGDDLDTNDDGVLDTLPWTEIVDSVSLIDGDATTDFSYSSAVVGPDGSFTPAGTYRCPDAPAGTFDNNQLAFGSANGTPGASNGPLCVPVALDARVHEVQGPGNSVAITTLVAVEAIVVGDYQLDDQLDGFFIQEEDGHADADPNTSEGIFVYCGGCDVEVAVGDLVQVAGVPEDFFGMSQIDTTEPGGAVSVVSSANPLPTPAVIDLPAGGSTTAEGTFETVEGMLVAFADELFVSEYFQLARYGQLVLTADARPAQFTDANEPDVAGYAAFLDDLSRKRIILDDDNNTQNAPLGFTPADDDPYFWPYPGLSTTNFVRGGDSISGLTGVMHWSFAGQSGTDAWRVRPVTEAFSYNFTANNPRTAVPAYTGGSLKVASFNVLNFFTTINSRGADSPVELDRQREKIAAAICAMDADIVGLIEIENNGSVALEDLLNGANGVNANCGPYEYIDTGIIGTDAIAVAFIYKPATVSSVGDFAILDSSVDPRFIDTKNRPALAQTFQDSTTGGIFTVVVNHLKSKGSPCDDVGDPNMNDGQANCNQTRADAAAAMVDWLATDPTGSGDADFLIIGDLNAYRNEDPIDALEAGADDTAGTADDYTDLLDALLGSAAYSYLFDGQLGYLDHALANDDLLGEVTGVTVWHINADEIPIFDYNDGIRDAGEASFERESTALDIFEANAYRASDHDPVLVGLNVCDEIAPTATVTVSPDTLWPPNHKYVTIEATVAASDNFDLNPTITLLSVTSNEPDNGLGDGDKANDIVIVDSFTFELRAERSGTGDGRIYTITYQITDACGNSTIVTATVTVPVNQGKNP